MCDIIDGRVLVATPYGRPTLARSFAVGLGWLSQRWSQRFTDSLGDEAPAGDDVEPREGTYDRDLAFRVGDDIRLFQHLDRLGGLCLQRRLTSLTELHGSLAPGAIEIDRYACLTGSESALSAAVSQAFGRIVGARIASDGTDWLEAQPEHVADLAAGIAAHPTHSGYLSVLGVPAQPAATFRRPKVAIVDSGVDRGLGNVDALDVARAGTADDATGHGTCVAEVIRSICPDADLVSARVLDRRKAIAEFDILAALSHSKVADSDVINLSLQLGFADGRCAHCGNRSRSSFSAVFDRVIQTLTGRAAIVCAAGNYDPTVSTPGLSGPVELAFPARLGSVIAVAACDSTRSPSDLSRRGRTVDGSPHPGLFFAPGGRRTPREDLGTLSGGQAIRGTSISAAYVSGILAQRSGLDPNWSAPGAIADLIPQTSPWGARFGDDYGRGVIALTPGFLT